MLVDVGFQSSTQPTGFPAGSLVQPGNHIREVLSPFSLGRRVGDEV
ncbi:MAG: hypothetical protein VKL59_02810 [Nostocaceae cyanobacterium]|nr:hypothetical protein [Nostocaceae cyanobacterium]